MNLLRGHEIEFKYELKNISPQKNPFFTFMDFWNINIDPKLINEDKYNGVHVNLPKVEFRPKKVLFLNDLNRNFAFFAPPPRLF